MHRAAIGLLALVSLPSLGEPDTCETSSVQVVGHASDLVAPDVLLVSLEKTVDQRTFSEAATIAEATRSALAGLGSSLPPHLALEARSELGQLSQKRWAIKRGRKSDVRFLLKLTGLEEGELSATLVSVLDSVVTIDPSLLVREVKVDFSSSRRTAIRDVLITAALDEARHSAQLIAEHSNLQLVRVARVRSQGGRSRGIEFDGVFESAVVSGGYFSRSSFSVEATPERVPVATTIEVVFCAGQRRQPSN